MNGGSYVYAAPFPKDWSGALPVMRQPVWSPALTEDRIREIIHEELAKLQPQPQQPDPGWPVP